MRAALIAVLILAAGCLQVPGTTCEDGRICPSDRVCSSQGCVLPEQVDACSTLDDGDRCTFSGVASGRCIDGVCVSSGCGNDEVDADQGEVCDDGNTESGDGCRADCQKIEVCGDGLPDMGEACDDGNSNAADGCDACMATTWAANPLVGGNAAATSVGLALPTGVATDASGNVYIADTSNSRVRRVDIGSGVATTVAGTGALGDAGDGGTATGAQLRFPCAVTVDGLGNVYIADNFNHRIRRVSASTGIITTVAGTGSPGFSGEGGAATSAALDQPCGVAVDGLGNLYIADVNNNRIRRVDRVSGVITTVAGIGTGAFSGDGGLATSAELDTPIGVAVDESGTIYIADLDNSRIRKVDADTRIITTVAGTGINGFSGDGGAATAAALSGPQGLAIDGSGTLYISDTENHRVRRVDGDGVITTVAGTGDASFSGDSGPAASAALDSPWGVAADRLGNLYIGDQYNHRVRRIDASTGVITTVAGTGSMGFTGDGGAASSAPLAGPGGVAVDAQGNRYFADSAHHRIRRVDGSTGVITTVAGTGTAGFSGDGAAATLAQLSTPYDVAVGPAGAIYFTDRGNQRIRRVDATTGFISTVAGTTGGFSGDGAAATSAQLSSPQGLAVDGLGHLFVVDTGNRRIRRIDATTGVITTVAGNGSNGFSGDGVPAVTTELAAPVGVAVDGLGSIYIADTFNDRIRRVDAATGIITTVAGRETEGFSGDGGAATSAELRAPYGVELDASGAIYIADTSNHRIRHVDAATGIITTVAGNGTLGFSGDGGAATGATLRYPQTVAVDGPGILIADSSNQRVRRLAGGTGTITTVAGSVEPEGMGPQDQAQLADPRALVLASAFTLIAGGTSGTVQMVRAATVGVVAGRYPHAPATGNLARFRDISFGTVGGLAHDATAGVIYLTETTANRLHVVTMVDPDDDGTWTIAPMANAAGTPGFADGAAATARFRAPSGLYLDEVARVLYVADTGNHVIRAIDLDAGSVSTVAGTPQTLGYFGDAGAATDALLFLPEAITRCGNGDFFVADTGNHRVRRVSAGVITTVLGDGTASSSGQGSPARDFPVRAPRGLACDAAGNLYVTSSTTVRQVAADDTGVVDGSLGVASIFGAPPRTAFPDAVTFCLTGLAVVDDATLQVTDSCTGMLIELRRAPL